MSKQIIIEGTNGKINIEASRRATNESNLKEDIEKWKTIVQLKDENIKDNEIKNVIKAIRNRLKVNYEFHGLNDENNIPFKEVQQLAEDYLKCPKSIQISLCRNSTRQAIDEIVQYETLKKYIKNFEVINLPSGKYTLRNGDIKSDTSGVGEARSIDVSIRSPNYETIAWGFLKYSKVGGSIQTQQATEAFMYLEQAKLYCEKHKDNALFFIQIDGESGEKHLPMLNDNIKSHKDRIIIGNTRKIIDFFNNFNLDNPS
jgi:hypothetical protein